MKEYKHLSAEERQQMTFDWRYRGFTVLELLTEDECDEITIGDLSFTFATTTISEFSSIPF